MAVVIVAWRGLDDAWSESAAAMVPAILLTNSLTSHGAALPTAVIGIALDWVHVLAAAVWVGGLATLALVAPMLRRAGDGTPILPDVARRFTRFALVAVLAIVVSGSIQAAIEVGSWSALVSTPYGQGVLIKIALLLGMLVIALLHQRRIIRLPLERGVRLEFALGVVVLAVAAVVAGTTPARQSALPSTTSGTTTTNAAEADQAYP